MDPETLTLGRDRLTRIFQYLREFNLLRNPSVRQLKEHPWHLWLSDVPDHPWVSLCRRQASQDPLEDFFLRVRRGQPTPAPPLPSCLEGWVEDGWRDPNNEARARPSSRQLEETRPDEATPAFFGDEPERPAAFQLWSAQRSLWAAGECPARAAISLFDGLYELYGRIERESESVELVLGEGVLSWHLSEGSIYHPILLQAVQLTFDPSTPEFFISLTDKPPELYSSLINSAGGVEAKAIARMREELVEADFTLLGDDGISGFLKRLAVSLSPRGEFVDERPPSNTDDPRIGRAPVIFLRRRNQGFAAAFEAILEDLRQAEDLPSHLLRIAGVINDGKSEQEDSEASQQVPLWLTKPSNPEQQRIALRASIAPGVLVQGPPGTGKTYTIGNLIGHFLAQGKSILVTSHTTKALRMVRSQVEEQLQPLCASLLDSDLEGRRELEASVGAIAERLSKVDAKSLADEANQLESQLGTAAAELERRRRRLENALSDEHRDIVFGGKAVTPADAARLVHTRGGDRWIPGPTTAGLALPLSPGEIAELYESSTSTRASDENELEGPLPPCAALPTPTEFAAAVAEEQALDNDTPSRVRIVGTQEELTKVAEALRAAMQTLAAPERWKLEAILAGAHGETAAQPWLELAEQIERSAQEIRAAKQHLFRHDVAVSPELDHELARAAADEILATLSSGKKPSWVAFMRRKHWRRLRKLARVDGRPPASRSHFAAVRSHCQTVLLRRQLTARWDRQLAPFGAPPARDLGKDVELRALAVCQPLRQCLSWHQSTWLPLQHELNRIGVPWERLLAKQTGALLPPTEAHLSAIEKAHSLVDAQLRELRRLQLRHERDRVSQKLNRYRAEYFAVAAKHSALLGDLNAAVTGATPKAYADLYQRLEELNEAEPAVLRRKELLSRLEKSAPNWAQAIRGRQGPHGLGQPPGEPGAAWEWRQLHDELERRAATDLDECQSALDQASRRLRQIKVELIDRMAWLAQTRRTSPSQRQALIGWLDTIRKLGKGTGANAPRLRAAAARLMSQCQGAVPVWVMPLARVVQNFNPHTTRFDAVIIDEASQSDILALGALYLGRRVIVVGDHEQVSPAAVGQDTEVVRRYIGQFLDEIPNNHLYDGQTSIYDLARESFGGTIRLVEHFRCVADIIQFSNNLSYQGAIKPLRDASRVRLRPHLIPYRVEGGSRDGKTNAEEAIAIASILAASLQQPEYRENSEGRPTSFGVVSMLGQDQQALLIAKQLREHISPQLLERHRLLCGNAAQFQGDERDVVFLSLVDAPQQGPLPKNRETDLWKQRFNVAASRARDQLWVIHSLDPRTDLQPGDLRRRLIEHAEDPAALTHALSQKESRTESEFERQVFRRLIHAGYYVTPQWPVGAFRIDLVVEGGGRRLAVECDGDRDHGLDRLAYDLERQAVLERLGWTFARIRGSVLFRDPERAMKPVFARLEELDIPPAGTQSRGPGGPPAVESDLAQRVIRRAQELRQAWDTPPDSEDDVFPSSERARGAPYSK